MGNHASKTPKRSARKSRTTHTAEESAFHDNPIARDFHPNTAITAHTPHDLLHLQRIIGNQAVQRMLIQRAGGGRPDGGRPDAGRPDGGSPDAGRRDAGSPDAGRPDAGSAADGGTASGRAPVSLADAGNIDAFAHEAKAYWATNKKNTVEELYKHLIGKATSDLAALGVPAFKAVNYLTVSQDQSADGEFHSKTWDMMVNMTAFVTAKTLTMSQLSVNQISQIASNIYHESRHAEQVFRMARVLAGDGVSKSTALYKLKIPDDIMDEAIKLPMKGVGTDKALVDEARSWLDIGSGKYKFYGIAAQDIGGHIGLMAEHLGRNDRAGISRVLLDVEALITYVFDPVLAGINKLSQPDKNDVTIRTNINAMKIAYVQLKTVSDRQASLLDIQTAMNALYAAQHKAYTDFADENDAFNVGKQVKQSVLTKP